MSLKLHGMRVSNYYNIVKAAMLEKAVAFEEVLMKPSQEEAVLVVSPMGKVPALETPDGYLAETIAIMVYLDKQYPSISLTPADPFQAARATQVHNFADLYVDLCCRPLLGAAFFGGARDDALVEKISADFAKAAKALKRFVDLSGFIVGDSLTHADLAFYMHAHLAGHTMKRLGQPNPLTEIPGYDAYMTRIAERPSVSRTMADRLESLKNMG